MQPYASVGMALVCLAGFQCSALQPGGEDSRRCSLESAGVSCPALAGVAMHDEAELAEWACRASSGWAEMARPQQHLMGESHSLKKREHNTKREAILRS